MKSSSHIDKEPSEAIPLLEEVNQLLEKERNLMNLKVIEQHVEAKEWKDKYETLIQKMSEDDLTPAKVVAYEVAADVSSASQLKSWRNDVEKQLYLLPSSDMPWFLDVSNTNLSSNDLHRILMFPKTNNYTQTSVLNFHNCGLDDSSSKLLPHLLRFPNIAAIDFSCNNFAEMFQSTLLSAVEAKRLKLQYLLLHGNMQLSHFPLEAFLHHLSNTVWGLTVSLTDVASNSTATTMQRAKPKLSCVYHNYASFLIFIRVSCGSYPGRSSGAGGSSTPKHTARFLKHLNHVLDPKPAQLKLQTQGGKDKTSTLRGKLNSNYKNNEFLQPHRGAGGVHGAPQALCVLGLMHTILCDDSLSQLETTLKLTISSLTDLDLSYSFTGIKGAKVIGKVLRHRSCQLVRLSLMGNAFGDEATASSICPGLKASQTLTYLDLKSNNLTNSGVVSLTNALSGKVTFRKLLLEGNHLSLAAIIGARAQLMRSGAPDIDVNFGVSLAEPVPTLVPANAPIQTSSRSKIVDEVAEAVFEIPGQVSVALEPTIGEALLYSIESQKIKIFSVNNSKHSDDDNKRDTMDVMADKIAEARDGEVRLIWNMSVYDFRADEHEASTGGIPLFSKAVLCWEVRCVTHTNQVTILGSKTLLPGACLPIGSCISCSTTIPKPPFRTKLEIAVKLIHTNAVRVATKTLRVNAFGLQVFAVPSDFDTAYVLYGGDMPVWSASSNALLGTGLASGDDGGGGQEPPQEVPGGFVVARRVKWVGQHAQGVRICFRAKLSASYGVSVNSSGNNNDLGGHGDKPQKSILDSTWKMAEGSRIGYSWCVCRCNQIEGTSVVVSGEVTQSSTVSEEKTEEEGEEAASSSLSNNLLQPWLWQDQNVLVGEAATNDTFLLCVCVSSDPPVRNLTEQCKVQVSKCGFHVVGENYNKQKDILYECQRNPTVLYSSFNNSSISISL